MNCLALDDEPLALELLQAYIQQMPILRPQGFFNNPEAAKARLLNGDIDLIFLDIQMPDINGLQFLKQLEKPPMVIFTTAYAEFAVEGFNLDALDYLLKPFDFQRFEKSVTKATAYQQFLNRETQDPNEEIKKPQSLFVKVEYSMIQIPLDDILLIEGFDDYIKIYTGGKPILTLLPLKTILEMLPADRFVRVHRSFIVALDKIERFRAQKIHLAGREIPVGNTYKANLKMLISGPA